MDMSEIGRQLRQVPYDIDAALIPPEERVDGQSMT
jgi:hypothetical protein